MDDMDNTRFDAALALLEERRFFEAVEAFSALVALAPEFTGAYGNRGLAYLNLGRGDEARKDFEKVLQLDPEDAMGHAMLAELNRFGGDPAETLAHAVNALELDEDEPQAYFVRGWLFARAGQYDMATEDLARFLDLAGDNPEVGELLEACRRFSGDDPRDEEGRSLAEPANADAYLGRVGWSFNLTKNPDYEAADFPCAYAHCIRNCPPLSPETPDGCPAFDCACPGGRGQVDWCRENPRPFG